MSFISSRKGLIALAVGGGVAARMLLGRPDTRSSFFRGKVVLITGGSHGLGLALARLFAADGAKLAICARSETELESASRDLGASSSEVLAVVCDVSNRDQVARLIEQTTERYGRIDVVINNAGIIKVGPALSMTHSDFEEAMDVMFWGTVNVTLAAMPELLRSHGTIVNIDSVGGLVPIPHLLPYCCAKYAVLAFSEGLRAELRPVGVTVRTIAPGLMRTGSYTGAHFKGDAEAEAVWFGLGATLPGVSMSANAAARKVMAAARGKGGVAVLGLPAQLLARFHAVFPDESSELLALVNEKLLPRGAGNDEVTWQRAVANRKWLKALTLLGNIAGRKLLQPRSAWL